MRVALLGPFRLNTSDGRTVDVGGLRVRTLLARLALEAGRTVATEVLIADLWGSAQPAGALNALQSLVSRARRALDGSLQVRSDPSGYALLVDPDDVDADRFARLAAEGRRLLRDDRVDAAAATLREALALWRGGALADFLDAPFAEAQVARLDELRLTALEDRVEADLRAGRQVDLVPELQGLCARHPLRERLTSLRIRALYACGRQPDALAAFEELRRRLDDEFGVEPSQELKDLQLAVLRGDPSLMPRRTSHPAALPTRLSSFVGREREVERTRAELADSRLVTLFGPGGAGKTRLAAETAAGTQDRRVWFVELAPLRDDQDLTAAVLTALGVRENRLLEAPKTHALSRVKELLAAEPTLLVLDNCEHVIGSVAEFAQEVLGWSPQLRVLATSREPLAVAGETLLPVGPLELPESAAAARESAAVRLFADRAASARPGFSLDEDNIGDVVEICRRLDGMPLAIELAAARLRAMSARQIADRLDDRFRLLTNGNRTSMPRHRTLRAVVEWSWDLLTEQERTLARRMSVFAGSATPEAISGVCADAELTSGDAFYVLLSLVEKSLVEAVDSGLGMRYRMLETVRAFCAEQLDAAGERDALQISHAAHYVDFAESAAPNLHGADQIDWMDRLDADHDNIIAALHRAISSGDADRGIRLVAALCWYWSMAAQHEELNARLNAVLELPGSAPPESRAVVELMRQMVSDDQDWSTRLRAAVTAVRDTGAQSRYLYVAVMEPAAWMFSGEQSEMDRAVEVALQNPARWARAAGLFSRSWGFEHSGNPGAAEKDMLAALAEFRAIGDRWGTASTIHSLADLRSRRGDHEGAIEALQESAATLRELRSTDDLVSTKARVGLELLRAGDAEGAEAELLRADELGRNVFPHHRIGALSGLVEVARFAGNHAEAWKYLAEMREIISDANMTPHPLRQLAEICEARLCAAEGRFDAARAALARALVLGMDIRDMPMTAGIAEQVACLEFTQERPESAARLLGIAIALRGQLDEGDPEVRDLLHALGENHSAARDRGASLSREAAFEELRAALAS
ncbi:BTAD domain-containing putative transcriptional regulator [Saccharopolyspora sp. WRP15-2]|uniref:BTAD domain-containing putative transcriptional regulator n=1 Tax=Saccharopolyspora oryzae TaxID=2997343 RepID=A0ABT4USS1_9PSEU|nr:BTAD domain-containing putative transcriptional regulator [Saccharopolyspora oryzae]MDA3624772.1 BTAD domain-containing putative transcriptional regulator [Saccharopolyspora oryzae]